MTLLSVANDLINRQSELQSKGIKIIKQGEYVKFYYDLLQNPDFNDLEVSLCRGITFRGDKVVCCPFFKFGNYGENYSPSIDWASARVLEKLDGSLISLWYDNEKWHVSTSKNIDAYKCDTPIGIYTFGELFQQAASNQHLDFSSLNKNYTYIFELTSPYNKVVIPYSKIEIWHLGTRDNTTLQELEVDIGVQKPNSYLLSSLDECVAAAATFGKEKEGFVVVDKYYNRVKVKSPDYIALHHLANNGAISKDDIISLILSGEDEEYLSYFPEKIEIFAKYRAKLEILLEDLEMEWKIAIQNGMLNLGSKKEMAKVISQMRIPTYGFKKLQNPQLSAIEFLRSTKIVYIKRLIGV